MQLARLLCLTWLACSAGLLCKAMAVPHGAYGGSDHTVVERQLDFVSAAFGNGVAGNVAEVAIRVSRM